MTTTFRKATPLLSFIFLFLGSAMAGTWTTVSDGYWITGAIWSQGFAPSYSLADTIIIRHAIVLDHDLILRDGGHLLIDSSGGLCGHHTVTVDSNASIDKYGILELDTLLVHGHVTLYPPGQWILTMNGIVSGTGAVLESLGAPGAVGPWFDCLHPNYEWTSLPNEPDSARFAVFPNPARTILNITISELTQPVDIILTDLQSRVLLRETIRGIAHKVLDVSHYPAGAYLLTLGASTWVSSVKVTKY